MGGDRPHILGLTPVGLAGVIADLGKEKFRSKQILQWVYARHTLDFDQMTDLAKGLRSELPRRLDNALLELVTRQDSADGTTKFLFRLRDGQMVETVYIPEEDRGTVCVSTQVGCPIDCSFCMTATQGFARNLEAWEINAQVWQIRAALAPEGRQVTNVVVMGMGEPLLNLDNLLPALEVWSDSLGMQIGQRRITVSTAGLVPEMAQLGEASPVNLAISLHAVTDELRDELVPINKKYPLAQLMAACRAYPLKATRRITFEYIMLDGVNDSVADAKKLVKLLRGIPAKVNLIPFNPFPGSQYRPSSNEAVLKFHETVLKAGITVFTRKARGQDVDAACGQLKGRVVSRRTAGQLREIPVVAPNR